MTDKTELDDGTLKIGDCVLFKDAIRNCALSVEGILLEDLGGSEGLQSLQDSLFCVHLQRQYSASRDLNAFMELYDNDVRNIQDESAKKYLLALQRGRDNERKLNDTYMRKKHGQKVLFGEIIQLFHVKSGKYLVVIPGELAKIERENTQVSLDVNGNAYSWLQLSPRFKIDKDGDRVLSNSELYLKVAERTNEYIHLADREPIPSHLREVNCALEATSWRLTIYQSSVDSRDNSILLASQLVYINDPETRSNLTVSSRKLESLEDDENAESEHKYFHEHGDIILEPQGPPTEKINSNFLWFIELHSLHVGGPIKWKTDSVRFRHMNTGKYLKLETETVGEGDEASEEYKFTTSSAADPAGTLFSVNELNGVNNYLSNAKALQIGQGGVWVERGEVMEDSAFTFTVKGSKDKSSALSLIIHRFSPGAASISDDDVVDESQEASKEPLDEYVGMAARNYLQKYYDMTVVPKSDSINTVWPTAIRSDKAFFELVMQRTVYFSQGFPISSVEVELGIDKSDALLCKQRQNLLREQNSLEIVLRMINKLKPITEKMDRIKNSSTKPKRKKSIISDEEIAAVTMGQDILAKCFEVLYYSILNNEENQMYVADFMPVLLAHLSAQPLAGKCVTEMLSKNMELQETKIGTREIQIFVDKLRSSKMNAMYLQLLQSCCSCQGEGVDGNQAKVATMLFSDTNDIIIELHADYSRVSTPTWYDSTSLFIPSAPIAGSPVRGETLISKGLPQLSLAWTTNSIDFSPLGLFGKLSVNIEDLFRNVVGMTRMMDEGDKAGMSVKKLKNKKKSSEEQKMAVANYFIAEMFLGAEMCLDRNYIAMHKLDHLFPYEVLVTIVKLNVSSNLKSAAVRLLMCLHVDRDPQACSKIPCLTRTWSDIKKNEQPQLPYVEQGRRHMFALLQQLISDHIKEMADSKWTELSWHMLRLLRTLVKFNFYGTNEKMQDVIGPLIRALDRRAVVVAEVLEPPTRAKKPKGKKKQIEISEPTKSVNPGEDLSMLDGEKNDTMDLSKEFAGEMPPSRPWYQGIVNCCTAVMSLCAFNNDARVGVSAESKADAYRVPIRYSKAPIYELDTMVEAVDILAFTQKVIEDRNISLLLRHFFEWESGQDKRTPSELFFQACEESKDLTLNVMGFDDVMIDVLMFVHMPLVQSTLEVLMAHHSMKRILLDNAANVQLLASHKRERQYKTVDQMLQQLEQNAETQELWGELETEADMQVNKQTMDILTELTDICRIRRFVLEFDEDFMPDEEIQNLYRNLGCFEICMKVLGLLDSVVDEDEDGNSIELDEVSLNTRNLCRLCNELLYWFFLGNEKNQELGYGELEMFLDTLDSEIGSHKVIRAIFKMNESLMRRVPHSLLSDLVDEIVKNKTHHYLSLFAAIPNVGEKNIVENQFEIVKTLTSPGRLQKVGCFLVPVDHPDYAEKRELMAPFLGKKGVTLDELPPLLAYHLMFLEVLSGCTVGRLNVTTVEAKVQSVFNYEDIIGSMLDDGTILIAKIIMGRYLFNACIEVELVLPGLDKAFSMWKLLESFQEVLVNAKEELVNVDRNGWEHHTVDRQTIEYILIAIKIIGGFFSRYYDHTTFKYSAASATRGRYTKTNASEMIQMFFTKIKEVHDLDSPRLSDDMKTTIYECLTVLKKSGNKSINVALESKSSKIKTFSNSFADGNLSPSGKRGRTASNDIQQQPMSPDLKKAKDDSEAKLIAKYNSFLEHLENDSNVQYQADNENVAFIEILEAIPFINDDSTADVRYETLIKKLVSHIRENIRLVNNKKTLDDRVTKTSTWIIRAFRTMIENKMGMSIYERDDDGGAEQDEAAAPVVNALNSCGATALCLDLIADGIDEGLQLEAVKMGVGLLFKEGGALEVQELMNNHLSKTNSELFFKQVKLTLQKLEDWHNWHKDTPQEEMEDTPPIILIVRFLQLMCEGHYLPNQDIMREQPHNHVNYNLLDSFVSYLNCLSRIPCRTSTSAAIRLTATILEVIQGPCEGNQKHFALETELVESLNRLNRAKLTAELDENDEIEVKKISIDIFQGLLEGQGDKSVVYERVLSVIHLDIIQMMSKKVITAVEYGEDGEKAPPKEPSEDQIILQTECVVLLQMLCNFKPSLYDELGISRNVEDIVGSGTAMIEIIWRGDIHRRFFHVPSICDYLAKSSKDNLVENVDRSNAENKLIDFLARSHEMYREVKHQQLLTEWGISKVFSRSNQNTATWISFILSIIINGFFLANYSYRSGEPKIEGFVNTITTVLNIIQACVSLFTLILWLVVRSPVNYQTFAEEGHGPVWTVIYTAFDGLTVYYVVYLVISVLGASVANYFCALLLVDIVVKNSTTRDVLNSIVTPRKQLAMGMLLEAFVIYIYAFFIFFFFQEDLASDDGTSYCNTLWNCLKINVSYGFQNGGGIADSFAHTDGWRLILDLSFFCVVLVILLNVIFGMIIDTFSSLRAEKLEKMRDTMEICFICGIEKQVFDRASDEPDGFKTHIKIDHNMWNYLYFIFMLWEQDKDDDDGLEQYVRRAIEAEEISWMPMNKAMRLEQVASGADVVRKELKDSISATGANLSAKLDEFQTDVNLMFQQLMTTLKQETNDIRSMMPLNTLMEFDEQNGDDMTLMTEMSGEMGDEGTFGYHVSLAVEAITGVDLSVLEPNDVTVRVLTDGGFHSVGVREDESENETIYFDDKMLPLFDNVYANDTREAQIQVLYGSMLNSNESMKGLTVKFLGEVHLYAVELLSDETNRVIKKTFQAGDQQCTMVINVKVVKATTFGREDEEEDFD